MKKAFESASQFRNSDQVFSKFSEKEILNPKSMNLVRGGDGGSDVIIIPPPPHP